MFEIEMELTSFSKPSQSPLCTNAIQVIHKIWTPSPDTFYTYDENFATIRKKRHILSFCQCCIVAAPNFELLAQIYLKQLSVDISL